MKNKGAVNALVAEHKKAIAELQEVISTVTDAELVEIADLQTQNPDCKSIQTVLSHVISAGFSYNVYIRNHRGIVAVRPERKLYVNIAEFQKHFEELIKYTEETFSDIYNKDIEVYTEALKIHTKWHQSYDIEQLLEHAIVHVLRHRRQIQGFIAHLRS